MALREIKTKIGSLKNTGKITKAMEVVSSVKLKKIEASTVNANRYLTTLKEFLYESAQTDVELNLPLFNSGEEDTKDALILVIGSGKGLVGPLLHQLKIELFDLYNNLKEQGITPHIVSVKTKTLDVLRELNLKSEFHFAGSFESGTTSEITPIKKVILEYYPHKVQKVYVVFMRFKNAFLQESVSEVFLPIDPRDYKKEEVSNSTSGFVFEPGAILILQKLLEDYLEAFLVYILLNSSCSEYASRVVTMKQANKNATDLQRKYQLQYNKLRQTQITSQIQETYLSSYIQ